MKTIADLIDRDGAYYPDNDAFVFEERRLNYRDYLTRSRQLAAAFQSLGLQRQDRVGILSTNNIEYFEVFGACEFAGFITALYNFRSAAPEVIYLIQDSAPRVVVFEQSFAPMVSEIAAKFPGVIWICIGSEVPNFAQGFETVMESGKNQILSLRARPEDIAYLFYTSGTTGRPKGVPWSQASAVICAQREGRTIGANARVLSIAPAFHCGGKGFPLAAMFMGGTTVLTRNFDPQVFLKLIAKERITHSFMVPMMMQAVMDHPDFETYDLSALRGVMSASTVIPTPLLKRSIEKFGPVFYVAYGSTECGNVASMEAFEVKPDGTAQDVKRLSSVGRFKPEMDAILLDDTLQPCKIGQIGEVCIKGYVFQGYWNNSIATIEATRSGWFHTGDMGYLDEEGFLFLVDRKKDMIISGGENIYSREVENALISHVAVQNVAVIAVPDPKWDEVVKAVVVLKKDYKVEVEELLEHCKKEIARYKCPRSIVFVEQLPMLATGKIDKISLRKQFRD